MNHEERTQTCLRQLSSKVRRKESGSQELMMNKEITSGPRAQVKTKTQYLNSLFIFGQSICEYYYYLYVFFCI